VINKCQETTWTLAPAFFADGRPCPALLTQQEAALFLRLEENGARTLKYYQDRGELIGIKVGRFTRYRLNDLQIFLAKKSEAKRERLANQAKGL
jgi:hypothetical protein